MLSINIICVGKLKEKFYTEASEEYLKRLSAYCKIEITEIPEAKRPKNLSKADIDIAMQKEAELIRNTIYKGAAVVAMCIEGKQQNSEEVAEMLSRFAISGDSKVCFIIGGSDGLDRSIKDMATVKLSMSKMTFPHHLARVMLLEQIYRGFKINEGGKYHK